MNIPSLSAIPLTQGAHLRNHGDYVSASLPEPWVPPAQGPPVGTKDWGLRPPVLFNFMVVLTLSEE